MADYIYAVARIRALEPTLFSGATLEQLMACRDYSSCLQFLTEKGWGNESQSNPGDSAVDGDKLLADEEKKSWALIEELAPDMSVFDVLSYQKLYHNLKAALKQVAVGKAAANVFYEDCEISAEEMNRMIREKDFSSLPEHMKQAAEEAYDTIRETGDGQLCDIIVDRACLEAVYAAGKQSKVDILKSYAETTVAVADIKIAVRCQKTAKSLDFMKRAMACCDSINVDLLAQASLGGLGSICEYLSGTTYAQGAEALAESPSAFERWCDNRMMETIRPEKYDSFTAGPLAAYLLAKENEIKTVRIILTGKQNRLPDEFIRERIREMYV